MLSLSTLVVGAKQSHLLRIRIFLIAIAGHLNPLFCKKHRKVLCSVVFKQQPPLVEAKSLKAQVMGDPSEVYSDEQVHLSLTSRNH